MENVMAELNENRAIDDPMSPLPPTVRGAWCTADFVWFRVSTDEPLSRTTGSFIWLVVIALTGLMFARDAAVAKYIVPYAFGLFGGCGWVYTPNFVLCADDVPMSRTEAFASACLSWLILIALSVAMIAVVASALIYLWPVFIWPVIIWPVIQILFWCTLILIAATTIRWWGPIVLVVPIAIAFFVLALIVFPIIIGTMLFLFLLACFL